MSFKSFIAELATTTGKVITFKVVKDIGGENRGWYRDEIEAYVDGKKVGFIKPEWIPKERFKKYYPTILNYLVQIHGKNYLPYDKREGLITDLTDDELRYSLTYMPYFNPSGFDPQKKMSRKELLKAAEDAVKVIEKRYGKEFKEFRAFWVNKPLVGYIEVDVRREHIGLALYAKCAEYLDQMGMRLHKSDTISPQAQATWDYMGRLGWTQKEGKRIVIVYNDKVRAFLKG